MEIKLLDCTLRDGGYVNNWEFGQKPMKEIAQKLFDARIDIVECGLFSINQKETQDNTILNSVESINKVIGENKPENTYVTCLANYGDIDSDQLPEAKGQLLDGFRIAFHKKDLEGALLLCKRLKEKGYSVYVQPMVTLSYTDEELLYAIKRSNEIQVDAFAIVDSFGTMQKQDLLRIYCLVEHNLNSQIPIDFHSHNNLQLSFSNAQELLTQNSDRQIIIDSSVYGMGRGAGNLCTELLANYLNTNYYAKYNILPILEIIDDHLNAIFQLTPWGYSVPYYIASINRCHPNYATYLMNRQTIHVRDIHEILSTLPADKRNTFDSHYIEEKYNQYQQHFVDDKATRLMLTQATSNRTILILAPGQTLSTYNDKVRAFIEEKNPYIIAVNFMPENSLSDVIFLTNIKRIGKIKQFDSINDQHIVVTSNICSEFKTNCFIANYASYLNSSVYASDNAVLMLIMLLEKCAVTTIFIAGMDGFYSDSSKNYFDHRIKEKVDIEDIKFRNDAIKKEIKLMQERLNLTFITPSLFA